MRPRPRNELQPVHFKDGSHGPVPHGVSEDTISVLKEHYGPEFKFFAMQSAVISYILHATRVQRSGDVVLRSPTGSGKTLAYLIPIVERLRTRTIPRLRAIVLVPTHDLAVQVQNVFQMLTKGLSISCVVATGGSPLPLESKQAASAEVLIATPGRLLDHVENTPGVTLAYVEFLVLDESDRILQDSFYGWADVVMPRCGMQDLDDDEENNRTNRIGPCAGILSLASPATLLPHHARTSLTRKVLVSATATRDPQRIAKLHLHRVAFFEPQAIESTAIKEKTTSAGLDDEEDDNYSLPQGLAEQAYVLDSPERKPMALLSVLGWNPTGTKTSSDRPEWKSPLSRVSSKLIFTKSVVSAHRLTRLLELFAWKLDPAPIIVEISRDVSPERREAALSILKAMENEKGSKRPVVLVCSDVFARGMDMPSVGAIINYDYPPRLRTYLHRVGRTARAGRSGIAVSLLLPKQVHHFKAMVKGIDRGNRKCKFQDLRIDAVRRTLQDAVLSKRLDAMHRILRRELLGVLTHGEPLPGHVLAEMNDDDQRVFSETREKRKLQTQTNDTRKIARSSNYLETEDAHDSQLDDGSCAVDDGANDDDNSNFVDEGGTYDDSFLDLVTAHVAFNWHTK